MTAERPYTDADVRLVTAAIAGDGVAGDLKYRSLARDLVAGAVLDALTAAGWRNLRHVIGYRIPGDMLLAPEDVVIVTGQSITHTTPPERGEQDD